jgi:hypothetical protein
VQAVHFPETVLRVAFFDGVVIGAWQHEQRPAHRLLADAAARELARHRGARRLPLFDLAADHRERQQQRERDQQDHPDFQPQSTSHRLLSRFQMRRA